MNYDQMIAVLQAAKDGKAIQRLLKVPGASRWEDDLKPSWDFSCYDYRVKPEPRVFYAAINSVGTLCAISVNCNETKKIADRTPDVCKVVKLVEAPDDSM